MLKVHLEIIHFKAISVIYVSTYLLAIRIFVTDEHYRRQLAVSDLLLSLS